MTGNFREILAAMRRGKNGGVDMRGNGGSVRVNGQLFSSAPKPAYNDWSEYTKDLERRIDEASRSFDELLSSTDRMLAGGSNKAPRRHINRKIDSDLTTGEAARMKRLWKYRTQDELHDYYEKAGERLHNRGDTDEEVLRKLGVNAETMASDRLPSYEGYKALMDE